MQEAISATKSIVTSVSLPLYVYTKWDSDVPPRKRSADITKVLCRRYKLETPEEIKQRLEKNKK